MFFDSKIDSVFIIDFDLSLCLYYSS